MSIIAIALPTGLEVKNNKRVGVAIRPVQSESYSHYHHDCII
jgi:hypothetical protein